MDSIGRSLEIGVGKCENQEVGKTEKYNNCYWLKNINNLTMITLQMRLTIKFYFKKFKYILLLFFAGLLFGCDNNAPKYNYIKLLGIVRTNDATILNKGLTASYYFYYNFESDSLVIRDTQLANNEDDSFYSYAGKLHNSLYRDTIAELCSFFQKSKGARLVELIDSNNKLNYGQNFHVEYRTNNKTQYKALKYDKVKVSVEPFQRFLYDLKTLYLKKSTINFQEFNDTKEVVHYLKGIGIYDSISPNYILLPRDQGMVMEKLVGEWRTFGNQNNDPTFNYWRNIFNKDGSWSLQKINHGVITNSSAGTYTISMKENLIKLESPTLGKPILEVLNLTDNCLDYRPTGTDHIWRFDRVK